MSDEFRRGSLGVIDKDVDELSEDLESGGVDLREIVAEEGVHRGEGVRATEGGRGEAFGEGWEGEAGGLTDVGGLVDGEGVEEGELETARRREEKSAAEREYASRKRDSPSSPSRSPPQRL